MDEAKTKFMFVKDPGYVVEYDGDWDKFADEVRKMEDLRKEIAGSVVTQADVNAIDQAVQQQAPAPQPQAQAGTLPDQATGNCPLCQSALKNVPAGTSKAGKPYPSFLSCTNQGCTHTQNI